MLVRVEADRPVGAAVGGMDLDVAGEAEHLDADPAGDRRLAIALVIGPDGRSSVPGPPA